VSPDSDYSIRRLPGTGEIASYHAVTDREDPRQQDAKGRKGKRPPRAEPDEAAVSVELSDSAEAQSPPQDADPPEEHEIDVLA